MPTLTQIAGYLFDATGEILRQGSVTLTLQQDMVSLDSTKVAPFSVVSDLSPWTTASPTPTVTPQGTTGATAYSYKIVSLDHGGQKVLAGTAGTTAAGNATLSVTNYNRIAWPASSYPATYEVYGRTSGSWLLIGATTGLTFDDTGAVTPSGAVPSVNNTGGFVYFKVYATVGGSPAGLAYFVEFDPDPADTTRPARTKDGYWYNYWSVPDATILPLGTFTTALRGQTSANYMLIGTMVPWTQISGIDTYVAPIHDSGSTGTAVTLDLGNTPEHEMTLTGNAVVTLLNPVDGGRYLIVIKQNIIGGYTATWPASVIWSGGTPPVITTGAGKVSVVILTWVPSLSRYLGSSALDYTV